MSDWKNDSRRMRASSEVKSDAQLLARPNESDLLQNGQRGTLSLREAAIVSVVEERAANLRYLLLLDALAVFYS
jgi:hypothetical protein